jgi:FKBP-type peptidyl-prolyl cis-trans isomerase
MPKKYTMNILNIKSLIIITILITNINSCKTNNNEKPKFTKKEYTENMEKVNIILVRKDIDEMQGFARNHNWNMTLDSTGFLYEIYHHGNGEKAQAGKYATINYKVWLLDGTLCYSSDSLGPKTFLISQGGVETGLEYGILKMRTGDKARFLFPPHLAHGLIGDENKIPPRSIIYYDVELLSLD